MADRYPRRCGRERFTFADHQNGPKQRRIMTAMTTGMPTAEALLELFPAESGGLHSALQAGTRSLIIVFPSVEEPGAEVSYGAVIDTGDGSALIPGTAGIPVTVRFWADEAAIYAVPGAAFTLWYGRLVGTGAVTRIDDVAATARPSTVDDATGRWSSVPIDLRAWFDARETSLLGDGYQAEFTESPPGRDKQSVSVTLTSAARIGQLVIWDTGEAELSMADAASGTVIEEHREITSGIGLRDATEALIAWLNGK
jgi:hypothetical protein